MENHYSVREELASYSLRQVGLRYQKRVNLGGGAGLNVSKSGVSPSYRTKYGSIGFKGFSFRTGIPGLSFRSSFGGKNGGAFLIAALIVGAAVVAGLLIYNIIAFLLWGIVETYKLCRRLYLKEESTQIDNTNQST